MVEVREIPLFLKDLKIFYNITAIVTVADDGGSSGMIRDDFGVLPPGDIRACLISICKYRKIYGKIDELQI